MKGTIRVRENRNGPKSYVCRVKPGGDPGTGRSRVLTGTARSERAARRLVHELIAQAEDRSMHAGDVTVAAVIAQWLATVALPARQPATSLPATSGCTSSRMLGAIPLRRLGVAHLGAMVRGPS